MIKSLDDILNTAKLEPKKKLQLVWLTMDLY